MSINNLDNLDKITNNSDIQIRRKTNEVNFNGIGCFTDIELEQLRELSKLPIDQVPAKKVKQILSRFETSKNLGCDITAADANAISNFFCLNKSELEILREDTKRLPDTIKTDRIEEILKRMKQARENRCEISTLDFQVMKKFLFLLEVELSLRKKQCFPAQLFNDLLLFATEQTDRFTDPELAFLIRSITRNTAIGARDPSAPNCRISIDQEQIYRNLLTALKLERERRIAAGVPKEVAERTRLDLLSEEATIVNELTETKKKLPNLTVNQISINTSKTILGILEDFLNPNPDKTVLDNTINTITKDSRPIYIGLFLIIVSLFIGLFRNVA